MGVLIPNFGKEYTITLGAARLRGETPKQIAADLNQGQLVSPDGLVRFMTVGERSMSVMATETEESEVHVFEVLGTSLITAI